LEIYDIVDRLDWSPRSVCGKPRVATHAEGNCLRSGEADACAML
jgi:hypothetical protein